MAFVSSPSPNSTNEVPTDFEVSTASPQVRTANLSDVIVYAFLANQPNGSQLVHEDLEQIHEDDLEEIDLKWQLELLSMRDKRFFQKAGKKITINGSDIAGYDKAKVECFNCHKMGHFARECRVPRNQENRTRNQETTRRTINVEDASSKAMVAIDGAGFDWSYMTDDEAPTNMDFMDFSDSENESLVNENIAVLKRDILIKDSKIVVLKNKLEKNSIEKDDLDNKIKKFENASQSLDKLIECQITNKSKRGLGYVSCNVVPPPHTRRFSPLRIDLSHTSLPEFAEPSVQSYRVKPIEVVTQTSNVKISEPVKENNGVPIIEDWESEGEDEVESPPEIERKTIEPRVNKARCKYHQRERMVNRTNHSRVNHFANTVSKAMLTKTGLKPVNSVRPVNLKRSFQKRATYNNRKFYKKLNTAKGKVNTARPNSVVLNVVRAYKGKAGHSHKQFEDQGYFDSRCSRHMTVNISYLTDFKEFDGRYVAFGGGAKGGKITGKGIIRTADKSHVLLKVPRKKNMYSVDIKNIVPTKDLTCLVAKATNDESMLWHRRLSHINFKNINKLVKENLVRGDGPKWLFDIDALIESMNYVPVIADSDGDNKDNDGACKESEIDNLESPNAENDTKDVNTTGPSINTASSNINTASPTVNTVRQNNDFFGADNDMRSLDVVEVDISNISIAYPVPNTPNTRIHKDHSLDNVIGDIQSGVQARRMTVTTDEQGFISAIYEEKTHEDLHTCLFACFLSQKEPKSITNVLKDLAWVEMDVKSAFLYGRIKEEVYVCQPPGFEDPGYPDKVYKVEKVLYGMHQAPRAWYETLAKYLLDNGFHRGKIDQTLFIKRQKEDILLIQVKFKYTDVKPASTLIDKEKAFIKDSDGDDVDVHIYRDSSFDLVAYKNSDYVGASLDRKSTSGGCQFLGCRLISWQWKKQTVVATSTTKAEYVATASCCGQVLWIQNQLLYYGKTRTRTRRMGHRIPQFNVPSSVPDEAITKEMHDGLERATTTAYGLEVEQGNGKISKTQTKATPFGSSSPRTSSEGGPGCHDEEASLDKEDSPKQGRMIEEINEDENTNLVKISKQGEIHETAERRKESDDTKVVDFSTGSPQKDDDEETLTEILVSIKKSVAKDKGKAIMQEFAPLKKIKKKEMMQISLDEEIAQRFYEEEQA
uniref:Retrotransposon protein, putative, Ty1-copia subclass n=1 Tax=Tanacetum cinerariifolium TaxID=118510 RepID=A0A6L2MAS4_TANCI|nr:retrotransposon protein, putative, Ty1-copia subclass [Tanacetum cinerariifolium]